MWLNTVLRKNKCIQCSKKLQHHKPVIKCTFCVELFHVKCAKLQPDDLNMLNKSNLLNSWTCCRCTLTMFPLFFHNPFAEGKKISWELVIKKWNWKTGKYMWGSKCRVSATQFLWQHVGARAARPVARALS